MKTSIVSDVVSTSNWSAGLSATAGLSCYYLLLKITPTQPLALFSVTIIYSAHRVHALVREFACTQIGKFQLHFSGNVQLALKSKF